MNYECKPGECNLPNCSFSSEAIRKQAEQNLKNLRLWANLLPKGTDKEQLKDNIEKSLKDGRPHPCGKEQTEENFGVKQ